MWGRKKENNNTNTTTTTSDCGGSSSSSFKTTVIRREADEWGQTTQDQTLNPDEYVLQCPSLCIYILNMRIMVFTTTFCH